MSGEAGKIDVVGLPVEPVGRLRICEGVGKAFFVAAQRCRLNRELTVCASIYTPFGKFDVDLLRIACIGKETSHHILIEVVDAAVEHKQVAAMAEGLHQGDFCTHPFVVEVGDFEMKLSIGIQPDIFPGIGEVIWARTLCDIGGGPHQPVVAGEIEDALSVDDCIRDDGHLLFASAEKQKREQQHIEQAYLTLHPPLHLSNDQTNFPKVMFPTEFVD